MTPGPTQVAQAVPSHGTINVPTVDPLAQPTVDPGIGALPTTDPLVVSTTDPNAGGGGGGGNKGGGGNNISAEIQKMLDALLKQLLEIIRDTTGENPGGNPAGSLCGGFTNQKCPAGYACDLMQGTGTTGKCVKNTPKPPGPIDPKCGNQTCKQGERYVKLQTFPPQYRCVSSNPVGPGE
jgi:hypothetical protein